MLTSNTHKLRYTSYISFIRSLSTFSSSSSSITLTKGNFSSRLSIRSCPSYHLHSYRYFSSPNNFNDVINKMKDEYNEKGEKVTPEQTEGKESKEEETKNEESMNESKGNAPSTDYGQLFSQTFWKTKDLASSFMTGVKETWKEMIEGPKDSKIKKTVAYAEATKAKKVKDEEDDEEEAAPYTGPTAVVVSKSKRSTWEEMAARLENSPLIREMLKNSRKIGRQAASTDLGKQAQKIGEQVSNKIHDAREFWETTQNPIVYQISGVWESLTSPTEEGMAVGEIQRLDPEFRKEDWAEEVKREIAPVIIQAHLDGDLKKLKPRMGEAVYNKLAADIRTRKADGISIDTRILDIDELQVVIRYLETEGPLILVIYMVQQINCIRNREGEIIEGNENNVIARFYTLAFKQVYNDDEGTVDWKIVDYELSGGETYF